MSNILDSDQAQYIVGPDLGPNCLHRLTADDTSSKELKFDVSSNAAMKKNENLAREKTIFSIS